MPNNSIKSSNGLSSASTANFGSYETSASMGKLLAKILLDIKSQSNRNIYFLFFQGSIVQTPATASASTCKSGSATRG